MIDVKKTAELACLSLNEGEEKKYQIQLNAILQYVDLLQKVNTENIEPLITPVNMELTCREDKVDKGEDIKEVIESSPERLGNLFKVPPVV